MLTLTFAGDEAGDVSFAFARGASRYFVVAVIATAQPDELRQVVEQIRRRANLPTNYEFRFHKLSSARLRQQVFTTLADADFEGWAIVVDKSDLSDSFRVMHPLDVYLYFVTELIAVIPQAKREGATLILDEFGAPDSLNKELRRVMQARNIPRSFNRVLARRSRSEPLIQIADLIAGAVLRRDSKGDTDAYAVIADKLKRVLEFRG